MKGTMVIISLIYHSFEVLTLTLCAKCAPQSVEKIISITITLTTTTLYHWVIHAMRTGLPIRVVAVTQPM